ncbi:MAG: DUF5995 family protein [Cyclobacteriaceae bacterium]
MRSVDELLQNMVKFADTWEKNGDQRYVFLKCYGMMSTNMVSAINQGQFANSLWVTNLLIRFSEYYFNALNQYDLNPEMSSRVWRQVHQAAMEGNMHVTQNLLLGINAHINYDLPLALYDCLIPQYKDLQENDLAFFRKDHELVNLIIANTIDAVQDDVINPNSTFMAAIDIIFGRLDEWLLSKLISSWRNDVWQVSLSLLDASSAVQRENIRKELETLVLKRGNQLMEIY